MSHSYSGGSALQRVQFGKWTTDIEFQSDGPHADEEIFYQYYYFIFSGTSKNTGDPVEFGWWIEYSKWWYDFGHHWKHRMKGYRRDQYGDDFHLWTGEGPWNFRCYLEMYVDQSPSNWWTTCKFTVEGNEVVNAIFDYVEAPLLKRKFDQSSTGHMNWIEGWSTNGAVIQGYDVIVSHSGGGTVLPDEGIWRRPGGTSMQFTAVPNSNYYFHHWLLDGQNVGDQNPYTHYFDGDHTLEAVFYYQNGGCPYVSTWNGEEYVIDNNILSASEISNGVDVDDCYALEQTLAPLREGRYFSTYSVVISEFEDEHSYIDKAKLYAVDHDQNVNVALTSEGQILTYSNPNLPVSAVDNYGYDWLPSISEADDTYYLGYPEDYLMLDFGSLDISQGAKLVLRANIVFEKYTIHIQVLNDTGG